MKLRYFGILFLCFLSSCANEPMERMAQREDTPPSMLENEAYSESLEKSLSAEEEELNFKGFEQRAVQKVNDFADYLKILSDTTYEDVFRQQALEMANGLFRDGSISDAGFAPTVFGEKISVFLNEIYNNPSGKWAVKVENVRISKAFTKSSTDTFEAICAYDQWINGEHSQKKISVVLTKVTKSFGTERKKVWEVFLKDIRDVD